MLQALIEQRTTWSLGFHGSVALIDWRFKVPEPILIAGPNLIGLAIFWLQGAA